MGASYMYYFMTLLFSFRPFRSKVSAFLDGQKGYVVILPTRSYPIQVELLHSEPLAATDRSLLVALAWLDSAMP